MRIVMPGKILMVMEEAARLRSSHCINDDHETHELPSYTLSYLKPNMDLKFARPQVD